MSNELTLTNIATPTNVISDAISRALVDKVVLLPFVFGEDLPVGINVKLARKDGALGTGSTVTEVNNYSYSSSSYFTQSTVSLTAAKSVIATKISVETRQFGQVTDQQIINKQANALARTLDGNVKAIANGPSQSVTSAGGICSIEDLMDSGYLIRAGFCGRDGGRLVAFLDYKMRNQIDKQALQTGAAAFTTTDRIQLLQSLPQPNGYCGTVPGVDIYEVGSLPTSGGNRYNLVMNPDLYFFGIYGTVQVVRYNPGSQGLYDELTSYVFNQVAEWNDGAGINVLSTQ